MPDSYSAGFNTDTSLQNYAASNNPSTPTPGAFVNGQPDNLGYRGMTAEQMGSSAYGHAAAVGGVLGGAYPSEGVPSGPAVRAVY